ncbi:hypothetical protein G8A07_20935 [Roseateles sp. DAIF2]|uniref:hypothetical protein n=1 Tax=Roseateles sp. DAIF2 TaxID=2714952 RepID=UPI0018A2DEA3|nr:hypothetical protein [Roseateles sp. DAIF2]QPF75137.1 hypothetical protein G8A07_20935 [Roseateles sp. DAIF2]
MKAWLATLAASLICAGAYAQDESVYVQTLSCVGGPWGLKLPGDARKLRKLGGLLREQAFEVEHWEDYTATRKTLYFDGLELGIIEFSNDPARFMITYADLRSSRWNHLTRFKLGQPVALARNTLGASARNDKGLVKTYASESDSLQFGVSGEVVTRVSYSCYSG